MPTEQNPCLIEIIEIGEGVTDSTRQPPASKWMMPRNWYRCSKKRADEWGIAIAAAKEQVERLMMRGRLTRIATRARGAQ